MLRALAHLFSIHGQNDNQTLLDPKNHIKILDALAGDAALYEEYGEIYKKVQKTRAEIRDLKKDSAESARLADILKYQIAEIDAARLRPGEEEALAAEAKRLRNAEIIKSNLSVAERAMRGGANGIGAVFLASKAASALEAVAEHVQGASELAARLSDIKYELEDIADSLEGLGDFSDEDPTLLLDKIEGRLDTISKLQRKYGADTKEIISFRDEAKKRLDSIENSEERIADLAARLADEEKKAHDVAAHISEKRKSAAEKLTAEVSDALVFLDMPKVRFSVCVTDAGELTESGTDCAEFLISANSGEPLLPMEKIASGGELARIMLSLKSVLNESDGIGTVVFDEIDTGISGKTSRKVGIKLKQIGKSTQVICVTHSAQIASLAENHFLISKSEENGRAVTTLRRLDGEERVDEIARILGGINITASQKAAAREMISENEIEVQ